MNLFSAFFMCMTVIFSNLGHSTHPFCQHPLYQAATDHVPKPGAKGLSALQISLLNPFFVTAILQKPAEDNEDDIYESVVADLRHGLRRLALEKVWVGLSKKERKILYSDPQFSHQLKLFNLDNESPVDTVFFGLNKMKKMLTNPTLGLTDYSLKDLLHVLLGPHIKSRLDVAIRGVCQNLAPIQMPHDILDSLGYKMEAQIQGLAKESLVHFQEFLTNDFSLPANLTPQNFVWEMNLAHLDPLIALKNILEQCEYENTVKSNKLFSIINTPHSLLRNMIKSISTTFYNSQLQHLATLLQKSDKILTFFTEKNTHVLDEFTEAHHIKSFHFGAIQGYGEAVSLFFADPKLAKQMAQLAKMRQFMTSMQDELDRQQIKHDYTEFLRLYYSYYQSLDLLQTNLEDSSKIEADRTICTALGLPFPCFQKAKIAKVRLSRQAVNLPDDENFTTLHIHIGYHLDTLADFLLTFDKNSTKTKAFEKTLSEIQCLAVRIHKTIGKNGNEAAFESYLPDYNELRSKVHLFRQDVFVQALRGRTLHQFSPSELDYIRKRLTHLI